MWSLGIVYCCLKFEGFYELLESKVKSIEDYLTFFDFLVGYSDLGGLSYISNGTFSKLVDLSMQMNNSKFEKYQNKIQKWRKQIFSCQILKGLLNFECAERLTCKEILEFDLLREPP